MVIILYSLLFILGFLLIFFIALTIFPIKAGLEYLLKDNISVLRLRFKILGLQLNIPIKTDKNEQQDEDEHDEPYGFSVKKYMQITRSIVHTYTKYKDEIKVILKDIRDKITFSDVYFDIRFGTGNAASTGIMTGGVWTCSTVLLRTIKKIFGLDKCTINVTPIFDDKCFDIHVRSILKLQPVYIIIIVIKLKKIINIFKKEIKTNNKEKVVRENGRTSN